MLQILDLQKFLSNCDFARENGKRPKSERGSKRSSEQLLLPFEKVFKEAITPTGGTAMNESSDSDEEYQRIKEQKMRDLELQRIELENKERETAKLEKEAKKRARRPRDDEEYEEQKRLLDERSKAVDKARRESGLNAIPSINYSTSATPSRSSMSVDELQSQQKSTGRTSQLTTATKSISGY